METPIAGVLIDFDGTLTDTRSLTEGVGMLWMRRMGRVMTAEEILASARRAYEWGSRQENWGGPKMIAGMFYRVGRESGLDRWRSAFFSVACSIHLVSAYPSVPLFPYTEAALRRLREAGLPLGLVTDAKPSDLRGKLVPEVRNLFDVIITRRDVKEYKPSPEGLLSAAKQIGVAPERCVYIGDMARDMVAAKRAGMYSVALANGLVTRELFETFSPSHICSDFLSAVDWIFMQNDAAQPANASEG